MNIPRQRLVAQRLTGTPFDRPAAAVRWLGAVQAQDYVAATWALGLRVAGATSESIEQAFDAGEMVRTHVLRPTWHFVAPEDIRWLLDLTAPRVKAILRAYDRQTGLDRPAIVRAEAALAAALNDGHQLTRTEATDVLRRAGFAMEEGRGFGHLFMHAELDGVICSGARRGKQQTYALLDARVPPAPSLPREEALVELTRRYVTSHGPATAQDLAWWSGLTLTDARRGLDLVHDQLERIVMNDRTYSIAAMAPPSANRAPAAFLLPNYDEFLVAYADRTAAIDPRHMAKGNRPPTGNVLFNHTVVIDGCVIGIWNRTLTKQRVVIEVQPFEPLSDNTWQAVIAAADRYGAFLGLPAQLQSVRPES